jgi:hypothetical protein
MKTNKIKYLVAALVIVLLPITLGPWIKTLDIGIDPAWIFVGSFIIIAILVTIPNKDERSKTSKFSRGR